MREMLTFPEEADVLEELVAWGKALSSIRALILTSSRARSDGSADVLSDYDLIVAVGDATAFVADDAWASGYGQPLVRWGDQHELYGWTTYFRGVIYSDGVRVDYTVWPAVLLERVLEEAALPEDLASGGARWSLPSLCSTTTRNSSRYAAFWSGESKSTTTGRYAQAHTPRARTTPLSRHLVGAGRHVRGDGHRGRGGHLVSRRGSANPVTARRAAGDRATTRARSRRSSAPRSRHPAAPAPRSPSDCRCGSTPRSRCPREARP